MRTLRPSPIRFPLTRLFLCVLLVVAAVAGGVTGPPVIGSVAAASSASALDGPIPAATVKVVVAGVVDVVARTPHGGQTGSGVVVTRAGLVITNAHVVSGSDQVSVQLPGTGRAFPAELVGADTERDIAVLRVAARLRPTRVGDSDQVSVGDTVTSVGNAYGRGWMASGTGRVVATGVSTTVSGPTAPGPSTASTEAPEDGGAGTRLTGLIAARTNIRPGQSGGAMFNQDGEVVGINVAYALPGAGKAANAWRQVGYAVPINTALEVADRVLRGAGE